MNEHATKLAAWAWKKAPASVAISAACSLVLACVGVAYASKEYIPREEAERTHQAIQTEVRALKTVIEREFALNRAQDEKTAADQRVQDINASIRSLEREIADLEMVLAEMPNPEGDSGNVLRNRVLAVQQDLDSMRAELPEALRDQTEAARVLREARQ